MDAQQLLTNLPRIVPCQIEIGVTGQIANRGCLRFGSIVKGERTVPQAIRDSDTEISGIALLSGWTVVVE